MNKTIMPQPHSEINEKEGTIKTCQLSGSTLTLRYKREIKKLPCKDGKFIISNNDKFFVLLNCADGSVTFENEYDDLIKATKDFKTILETLQI